MLAHYGITEQTMGAPVVSSLEVVKIGTTPEGIDVSMDRKALESDGVMLLSRVKWHTSFEGKLESGVHKMMAIGLGKWEGARRYHAWSSAHRYGGGDPQLSARSCSTPGKCSADWRSSRTPITTRPRSMLWARRA